MAIKNKGIAGVVNKLTYDKPTLDKQALKLKKSFDEVNKVLSGNTGGKDSKKS